MKQMLQMLPEYCLVGLITFGSMVQGTHLVTVCCCTPDYEQGLGIPQHMRPRTDAVRVLISPNIGQQQWQPAVRLSCCMHAIGAIREVDTWRASGGGCMVWVQHAAHEGRSCASLFPVLQCMSWRPLRFPRPICSGVPGRPLHRKLQRCWG